MCSDVGMCWGAIAGVIARLPAARLPVSASIERYEAVIFVRTPNIVLTAVVPG
jgi:hypothetical protein